MARRSRIALIALGVVALLPLLAVVAVLIIGNTDSGRRFIERTTSQLTHGQVVLQGLAGRFPDRLRFASLQISDPQGPWLTVEDVALDSAPLELIGKVGRVERLHAGRLAIARSPDYGPPKSPPSKSQQGMWFREIRLDQLDLQRLELGAALAGEAVAFKVSGATRLYSLNDLQLQLQADRLDAVPSAYRLEARVDRQQVDVQATLEEGAGGPLTHLAHVPQIGALALHAQLHGPRAAVQTAIDLRAGPLNAAVNGQVNLLKTSSDLKVDADSGPITPLFGVSWQRMSLHGTVSGTPSAPTSLAHLQVAGLVAPDVEGNAIDATLHGEAEKLLLDATVKGFKVVSPLLDIPDTKPIALHGELRLADRARPIDFSLANALVNLHGRWNLATVDGQATAQVADIKPFVAMGSLDLTGTGSLEAKFSVSEHIGRLETRADLNIAGGAAPIATLLRPHARAQTTLLFRPDGLEFQNTRVTADNAQASMGGTILAGGLNLSYQASMPRLAALSPQLAGAMTAAGSIKGKAPDLAIDADANAQLSAHGSPTGALHLKVRTRGLPRHTTGSLSLDGMLDGAPIAIVADAQAQPDGGVAARIERGDWKSLHLEGDMRTDAKAEHPEGKIELRIAQLTDLDRLLGTPLQGSVEAGVVLDERHGNNRAHVTVDAHDVGIPAQQIQTLQVRGHIDRPTSGPELGLRLTADAQLNGRATHLAAQVRGPLDKIELMSQFALDKVGDGEGPVDAAAQFDVAATLDPGGSEVKLTKLNADYRKSNLHLLAPAVIDYGGELKVDQLRLGSDDARLQVNGRLSPTLDVQVVATHLSSAQLRALMPSMAFDGEVDAQAQLTGESAHPTGHVEMHAVGLRAGAGSARGLPASNIDFTAELAGDTAQVDLRMHAGGGLDFSLNGQAPMNANASMALKANGSFDLNVLNPILEAQGQRLQGAARVNAQIGGTPSAPKVQGSLKLAGVNVQDYAHGARLTDIQATLNADGETLTLQQFSAKAGPGSLNASGTIRLGDTDWPVDIKLSGHDAQPLASDLLTANVDLDLSLAGTLRGRLNAGGKIKVNHAVINIPNALPPDIPTLHVIRPGQKPPPPQPPPKLVVALDYTIDAERAVFVRGRGIDAEFGGEVRVRGTTQDIAMSGGFEMRQGRINLGGTTLQFDSDSRIAFNGTGVQKKIDPTLAFTATNNTGAGNSASLKVTGYADAPVISLSSVPEEPQDQIMAQLLFGSNNVSSLTALQAAQIGAALVTLGGVGGGGGGFNPINTVQKKLGLDRLSVGGGSGSSNSGNGTQPGTTNGTENNAATIEAGRYVSSRVYVGAKQSTAGPTQAEVQVDLTRRLKLQATLGTGGGTVQGATPQNDPGSSAGIAYQFEY
ncbi:MAG TPA: translocation/assembly module TamB domain-containing protein [Steroidobacteraceae bacterium]|nr:translocation/assembly module TamB domain-containing protein [Steroidobacteraceae bacterium]